MVQPQAPAGSTLQWEMTGGEAGGAGAQGSLRVPADLSDNEFVNSILWDCHQLRETLRRSNATLRERCDEMEQWQVKSRKEREFLRCRFQEVKMLVERLSMENETLRGQLNHTNAHVQTGSPALGLSSPNAQRSDLSCILETSGTSTAGELKVMETGVQHKTPQQSLAYSSVCQSSSSVFPNLTDSLASLEGEAWGEGEAGSKPVEGANEFLRLLKSHKDKLEERLQELRADNEQLKQEKQDLERQRDELLGASEQLRLKLSHTQLALQGGGVVEESAQQTDLRVPSPDSSHMAKLEGELQLMRTSYKELQEKFDSLQKTAVQRDKAEALLKQKDFGQMAKDSEALKSQVTSLLGELQERQSCLDKSEEERKRLQDRLSVKTETLQNMERDVESVKKQHSVTIDQLRMQTENLEAALKTERMVLIEEKRKLAQVQNAYTQLFQDYDMKLRNSGEAEDLANRLDEAERALALKQGLIDKLKEEVEHQRGSLETVPVLKAQADIYKADFLAEREAREKLNQRKEELQEQLNQALADLERFRIEGTSRARMEEMQQRHLEEYRPARPHLPPTGLLPGATVPFSPAQPASIRRPSVSEELPDFRCPKCQYQAPDMDTLQIHVMDCIQ